MYSSSLQNMQHCSYPPETHSSSVRSRTNMPESHLQADPYGGNVLSDRRCAQQSGTVAQMIVQRSAPGELVTAHCCSQWPVAIVACTALCN